MVSYVYDGLARLKSETETRSGQLYKSYGYAFDDYGNRSNLTAGGTEQYTVAYQYDRNNRLLNENKAQGATQTVTKFYHDKNGNQKAMSVSTLQDARTGAESLSLAEEQAGASFYEYNGNGHGDVVNLTDTSGSVTKTYDYDAFGNEKSPDEKDANPLRYCGEYLDQETGDYYLRARYYDPAVGRLGRRIHTGR